MITHAAASSIHPTTVPSPDHPTPCPFDHHRFDQDGYALVPSGVDADHLDRSIAAIFRYLGMEPEEPSDWYRAPLEPDGAVDLRHHQALWDNRQEPGIHAAFAAALGTASLWVGFDGCSFIPPAHGEHPAYDREPRAGWDIPIAKEPRPLRVQGLLMLDNAPADRAAFHCVPGFHREVASWAAAEPARRGPLPEPDDAALVPVEARAGDLILWDSRLPHTTGRNLTRSPRVAQHLLMYPAQDRDECLRSERIRCIESAEPLQVDPAAATIDAGGPRPPELSPLGRRLAGYEPWDR